MDAWIDDRLVNLRIFRDQSREFVAGSALDLANQVLRNTYRLLLRLELRGYPPEPPAPQNVEEAERQIREIRRWLKDRSMQEKEQPVRDSDAPLSTGPGSLLAAMMGQMSGGPPVGQPGLNVGELVDKQLAEALRSTNWLIACVTRLVNRLAVKARDRGEYVYARWLAEDELQRWVHVENELGARLGSAAHRKRVLAQAEAQLADMIREWVPPVVEPMPPLGSPEFDGWMRRANARLLPAIPATRPSRPPTDLEYIESMLRAHEAGGMMGDDIERDWDKTLRERYDAWLASRQAAAVVPAETTEPVKSKPTRVPRDEANLQAREALKNKAPKGRKHWSQRQLATAIGCSPGQIEKLPAWQAYAEEHGLKRGKTAGAVGLTDPVLNTVGQEDEELQRLVAEHTADFEPSPLVAGRRKVRVNKKL